jgi:HSP20 family molecular chaperone IbpA
VITDQVKASLENGILEVHLPKTDRARAATPKKVTVE